MTAPTAGISLKLPAGTDDATQRLVAEAVRVAIEYRDAQWRAALADVTPPRAAPGYL